MPMKQSEPRNRVRRPMAVMRLQADGCMLPVVMSCGVLANLLRKRLRNQMKRTVEVTKSRM